MAKAQTLERNGAVTNNVLSFVMLMSTLTQNGEQMNESFLVVNLASQANLDIKCLIVASLKVSSLCFNKTALKINVSKASAAGINN